MIFSIHIEEVDNGYIVSTGVSSRYVFSNLDDVLSFIENNVKANFENIDEVEFDELPEGDPDPTSVHA